MERNQNRRELEEIKELKKRISALEKENKELRKKKRQNRFALPKIREIVLSDGTTKKIS